MAKQKMQKLNIVYSTNPNFNFEEEEEETQDNATLEPEKQLLHILLDKKQRAGKEVTLIRNFVGTADDLTELGKFLKNKCGVGGSIKDGEIIIQGNVRDKIIALLEEKKYKTKRIGGWKIQKNT